MTANSQLISVKLLQGFLKKRLQPLVNLNRLIGLYLPAWNGNFAKRLFDIVFSLFVLIFFSPVYLMLMALVAIGLPGSISYI